MTAHVLGHRVKLASPGSLVFVLTLAAAVVSVPLAVAARQGASNGVIFYAAVVLLALVLGGVGLVVARNQLGNPMGWLMQGSGLCLVLGTDASFYPVTAFAARLKDTVDLDSVRQDLARVVHQALEPVHVSIWMGERR